jgi:integrase
MEWGCGCPETYQAQVWGGSQATRRTRTFSIDNHSRPLSAARAWRDDQRAQVRATFGESAKVPTVRQAASDLVAGMKSGVILSRSKDRYKPSVVRQYEVVLNEYLVPAFGPYRLDEIEAADIERLCFGWIDKGYSPSTVSNRVMPLRAIYRRAVRLRQVVSSPLASVELPAIRDLKERRYVDAKRVVELIAAAPSADRALWATAFYTGLRRGELQALRIEDVDLDASVVRVRRGWDPIAGPIEPKSRAGVRDVPLPSALRPFLLEQKMRVAWRQGLLFGRTSTLPFAPHVPANRGRKRWEKLGLEPVSFHDCRHTYASLMIAAAADASKQVNMKQLSVYMGHTSVVQTYDRYGHLLPGQLVDAAEMLDAYLGASS